MFGLNQEGAWYDDDDEDVNRTVRKLDKIVKNDLSKKREKATVIFYVGWRACTPYPPSTITLLINWSNQN